MGSEKIRFVSVLDQLDSIDECRPKPAKHFTPQWFKNIPVSNGFSTVRDCPSFPDFFSQGYVMPMWCESNLTYDQNLDVWHYETATNKVTWDAHGKNQFIDFVNPSFMGVEAQYVFKPLCPWRIITPPGWSVLQLPLFYHFNQKWSVLPGIVDTDIFHEVNPQILYHAKGETINIKRGEPIALYIPFKRSNKLKLEVSSASEKDLKMFEKVNINYSTRFIGDNLYRKIQRLRDKNG